MTRLNKKLGFVCFFVFASCQKEQSSEILSKTANTQPTVQKLDLNDVTVLLPLGKGDEIGKMISLSGKDSAQKSYTFLSNDLFSKIQKAALSQEISFNGREALSYNAWKIVGFRFDPCFPVARLESPQDCDSAELRLVAQPIKTVQVAVDQESLGIKKPSPPPGEKKQTEAPVEDLPQDKNVKLETLTLTEDNSMHLIFKVSMENRQKIARELSVLAAHSPVSTAGKPLGVHPGLAKSGVGGNYYNEFLSFLTQNLTPANLKQVAFMGTKNGIEPWVFFFVTVNGNSISAPKDMSSMGNFSSNKSPDAKAPRSNRFTIQPAPKAKDNAVKVMDSEAGPLSDLDIEVTSRIDNPLINSQGSTDCSSCHTSTTSRLNWEKSNPVKPSPLQSASSFLNNSIAKGFGNANIDVNFQFSTSWSLRNFGYMEMSPFIATRTLNETILHAAFINKHFMK